MFVKISDHVYCRPPQHYSDRPTIGYVKGRNASVLFDSGASAFHAKEILCDLEKANLPYPDYVVLSHWHWDHSFGLHFWKGSKTIAGKLTNDTLRVLKTLSWSEPEIERRVKEGSEIEFCYQKMKREYPNGTSEIIVQEADMEFEESHVLELGDVELVLEHVGGPHSSDSVIGYVPQDKVMFLGDSSGKDLYGKSWKFDIEHEEDFGKNVDAIPYDMDVLSAYLKALRKYDFDICVSGHSEPYSGSEFWEDLQEI